MKKLSYLIVALLFVSCIDYYKIKTKVNTDGSLERTFIVKGDSASIFDGRLQVPTDTSWKITKEWSYENPSDSSSDKILTYTATRTFKSFQELNSYLGITKDSIGKTNTTTHFEKRFRWFFTFISYKETYKKRMAFIHFPIDEFLNDYELSFLYDQEYTYNQNTDSLIHIKNLKTLPVLDKSDSLRLEELEDELELKWAEWGARNIYEEYFLLLTKTLQNKYPEKLLILRQNKDSIYTSCQIRESVHEDFSKSIKDPFLYIDRFIGLPDDSAKYLNPQGFEQFENMLESTYLDYGDNNTIYGEIEMPGLLLNTNADSICQTKSFWKFTEVEHFAEDYMLYTESRILNWWTVLGTSIACFTVLIFLVRSYLKT